MLVLLTLFALVFVPLAVILLLPRRIRPWVAVIGFFLAAGLIWQLGWPVYALVLVLPPLTYPLLERLRVWPLTTTVLLGALAMVLLGCVPQYLRTLPALVFLGAWRVLLMLD